MINSNVVIIYKYKRLYFKNSVRFVWIYNGKVDGFGDKYELSGEWCMWIGICFFVDFFDFN